MGRPGSAEQVSLSAGNGWRCLPPMQRSLHTLHLILRCTALPVVGLQGTSRAAPPPCSSREAWACSPRKSGPQSSSVWRHNQYGNGFIPPPFLFITSACPPPPSTPHVLLPSPPPLSPGAQSLRLPEYEQCALRGGGLAIKPHGAERWTIKPFESIKAKQHHFLASWHFYGRLGRGGRHPTPQLASYKLNEAKQNHPDGDTDQKQTTPFQMYGTGNIPLGTSTKKTETDNKLVAVQGKSLFELRPLPCTWQLSHQRRLINSNCQNC